MPEFERGKSQTCYDLTRGTTALECYLDTACVERLYNTDLGSLWIMFLRVVQEGRHVVVQISLETVDQVPASTHDSLLKTTVVSNKKQKNFYPNFCLSGKDLLS